MKIYSLCTLAVLSAAIMASCEDKRETPATPILAVPPMATPIAKDNATTPATPILAVPPMATPIAKDNATTPTAPAAATKK